MLGVGRLGDEFQAGPGECGRGTALHSCEETPGVGGRYRRSALRFSEELKLYSPNPEIPSSGGRGLQDLVSAAVDSTLGSGSGSRDQKRNRHPVGIVRVTSKEEKEGTSSGECRTQ